MPIEENIRAADFAAVRCKRPQVRFFGDSDLFKRDIQLPEAMNTVFTFWKSKTEMTV